VQAVLDTDEARGKGLANRSENRTKTIEMGVRRSFYRMYLENLSKPSLIRSESKPM
jgi:hypothetical protein